MYDTTQLIVLVIVIWVVAVLAYQVGRHSVGHKLLGKHWWRLK